jgi:hypothetical protein
VVLDGLAEVTVRTKLTISVSQVPVRRALPRPVTHLLCHRQVLRAVLDGLRIVPKRKILVAEVHRHGGTCCGRVPFDGGRILPQGVSVVTGTRDPAAVNAYKSQGAYAKAIEYHTQE